MVEERLSPRGERRADLRSALICLILASVHRGKGKKPRLEDFLLDFEGNSKGREPQSADEIRKAFQSIAATARKVAQQGKRNPANPNAGKKGAKGGRG